MAGRPPKPTHLKLIQGNPGKRALNKAEPKPAAGTSKPPARLSAHAAKVWPRVSKILDDMGVLTKADTLALEQLCEAYADGLEARASLANPVEVWNKVADRFVVVAEGGSLTYVTDGKSGHMLRTRPELALIADADRRFLSYLSQFGLTPAARVRVSVKGAPAADAMESYFG